MSRKNRVGEGGIEEWQDEDFFDFDGGDGHRRKNNKQGRGSKGWADSNGEKPHRPPKANPKHRNKVRIIGGTHRSRMVDFSSENGLRPTPDFVRERVFNWLGQDLTGQRVLDLFAGSGVMGFEAASRGAELVVLVESNRNVAKDIERNRLALGLKKAEVENVTAELFMQSHALPKRNMAGELNKGGFDVVFMDPPFDLLQWDEWFSSLPRILNDGAIVYAEKSSKKDWGAELPESNWELLKEGRSGLSNYILLRYKQ